MDSTDTRFFRVLQRLCNETTEVPGDCREAVDRAVETGAPDDLRQAREAVHALDDSLRDRLLRQTHLSLATDLSAVWDMLPMAPRTERRN